MAVLKERERFGEQKEKGMKASVVYSNYEINML